VGSSAWAGVFMSFFAVAGMLVFPATKANVGAIALLLLVALTAVWGWWSIDFTILGIAVVVLVMSKLVERKRES